ncbi:MAG: ATP-binding protein [Pseudomonadota bacterium]
MYKRILEQKALSSLKKYKVLILTGPRQSGKSTLSRMIGKGFDYVNLELPDVRELANTDPKGFFNRYTGNLIVDEIQYVPELFSYVQAMVDSPAKGKKNPRRFILTGSQQFSLMERATQTLAGRARIFQLLPLSQKELKMAGIAGEVSVDERMFKGGYPRIFNEGLDPSEWLAQYYLTYVERDVRALKNIGDLEQFGRFLRVAASRAGQLADYQSIARDVGISQPTAKAWMSVLKASYVCLTLEPHFKNFGKRMIKSPKIYFYDTGLLCYLLKIKNAQQLSVHPLRGVIFENWVLTEMMKDRVNIGEPIDFYFWRDQKGHEVDIVEEAADGLKLSEVKAAATFHSDFVADMKFLNELQKSTGGRVVYAGNETFEFAGYKIVGWNDL